MRFVFIPKQPVHIGKIVDVNGAPMQVESYSHTGRNVVCVTLDGAQRVLCLLTDIAPIEEIKP